MLEARSAIEKITLNLKGANLKELVKAIEEISGYRFIYSEEIVLNKPVTLNVNNIPVNEALDKAFSNQPVKYTIKGNHIVLTKKTESEYTKSKTGYSISGTLIDKISRETLIGANIFDNINRKGTTANEYGFYSLTLPEGDIELHFSYIGYEPVVKKIRTEGNILLNVELQPANNLNEVVVLSDKPETGINATNMGAMDIPLEIIKSTPSLLGESDVMKTLQMMPGVQVGTEGSAGIYVRGGGPDENLILLDGVPLYNVDHLFGFFSVFTPESLKKVSMFKGSFPARYGGRLSSVIDVRTNDGDMRNYHGVIGLGLLSAKIQMEGPIIKDRTAFHFTFRRSYLDLLARPFMRDNFKFSYFFYDLNAKLNHRFNDKHRVYLSVYSGRDQLDTRFDENWEKAESENKNNIKWGNTTSALRWNYVISPKLFSNTTVAYTEYKFNFNTKFYEKFLNTDNRIENSYSSFFDSGIWDWTFNTDFDYRPLPKHHIKFGLGYLYHCFKPEALTSRIKTNENGAVQDTVYNSLSDSKVFAHEASIYAEDNFEVGSRLSINAGLHLAMFRVQEKAYISLQPRVSVGYKISEALTMKGAYTKMSQYIHLLSGYTISMPTDLWVPATKHIEPMSSHQFSLGAYHTGIRGWEFSIEGYYKDMSNVLEYKDDAFLMGASANWEDKVEMGKGRASGIELMAQKTIGKTTGWLSYSLSKSDRKFSKDGINEGKRFPYRYDRRHSLNLTLSHKFSEKIDVGAAWVFYTGGVTTIGEEQTLIIRPDGTAGWGNSEADYIKERNNYRMPASHYLNVGINFNKKTKRGVRIWNFGLYNTYNAMNPTFIYKDAKWTDDGDTKTIIKKITVLPIIPSVSYTYKW